MPDYLHKAREAMSNSFNSQFNITGKCIVFDCLDARLHESEFCLLHLREFEMARNALRDKPTISELIEKDRQAFINQNVELFSIPARLMIDHKQCAWKDCNKDAFLDSLYCIEHDYQVTGFPND